MNKNNDIRVIRNGIRWEKQLNERLNNTLCLEQYGYKVFSQNDEDGIIQEIFDRIGVTNKKFVEFGVQNGLESNCHYLLYKGWNGLFIEGNEKYCKEIQIKFRPVLENGKLQLINDFVNRNNINQLIGNIYTGDIDLLSIDIDGNDYHIWKAIHIIKPRVVVIEYNGKFSPDVEWVMAYYEHHNWRGSDWHGASLKSLEILGKEKGYQLVGTNLNGANAFFVRSDLAKGKFYEPAIAEKLYNPLNADIRHISWHESRYCLVDQKEGLGIFNYTEKNILFFSMKNLQDGNVEYSFTCRNTPYKIKNIEIPVKNGNTIYKCICNNKELGVDYCKETDTIRIDMTCLDSKEAVLKVDIIFHNKEDDGFKLLEDAKVIYR